MQMAHVTPLSSPVGGDGVLQSALPRDTGACSSNRALRRTHLLSCQRPRPLHSPPHAWTLHAPVPARGRSRDRNSSHPASAGHVFS